MRRDLTRMLAPRNIAVIGGGNWCASIIGAARRIGFGGTIVPVHPDGKAIAGLHAVPRAGDCPVAIDAAFVGVNRHATIEIVAELAGLGSGGAVCFASGFTEANAEDADGVNLQSRLVAAAGDMPMLGPNCYGFVNAVDRAAIWPDQHGMQPVERGVAILTQSSNMAINMTMQQRALPIAYMITCGNMAQTSQAEIATALLDDARVTAIGLHVEGFGNLRDWEALAQKAHQQGIPLVAIKVGKSGQAQRATISHTASLAGSDAGAQAFLDRLGIARVNAVPEFIETLKLLHCVGPLASNRIASISCSGGEASLIADMATARDLEFPPLSDAQEHSLKSTLGPLVALANPLDYHTYVWRDPAAMARAWSAMVEGDVSLALSIVDYPHTDAGDWTCATEAAIAVRSETGAPFAVVASLPELMPLPVAEHLMAQGVVPMSGLAEALAATEAAARVSAPDPVPIMLPGITKADDVLTEAAAKAALMEHGLTVPVFRTVHGKNGLMAALETLHPPFALKGVGLAHKSEHGAVRLGLSANQLAQAAQEIGTDGYLIEEMVADGVAEILIGVTRDDAHGYVLTLGAGGILTELLRDTISLLLPVTEAQVAQALGQLKCGPLLTGYRGRPAADMAAILRAVMAVQDYVVANAENVGEVEINPLICTPDRAVAVDALIRKART
ncbi:acetate--CoA ligase family protein [Sedimentitalea todarodis]|uniref:Acetate--CoA ligase family protein n=1 Tax=Sedimentitalea todarodis TaxID=1631240 RepID=A0ABU3VD97_9RHOB|nr:acetate--CoA ligase family protein [Sedimentitalea todarodis]MDU9004155.1 acetate--CoA ligase family protein [Sedimentitalea todarodis]